jgi:uncharacterized protein (DUF58 family)
MMQEVLYSKNFLNATSIVTLSFFLFFFFSIAYELFYQPFIWLIPVTIILLNLFIKSKQSTDIATVSFKREMSGRHFFQMAIINVNLYVTNDSENELFRGEIIDTLPFDSKIKSGKNNQLVLIYPKETIQIYYSFTNDARGKHNIGPILYRYHGLNEREEYRAQEDLITEFTIVPKPIKISDFPTLVKNVRSIGGPFSSKLTGDGWSFTGIRDYNQMDSMKRINWKATAKVGELQTNEFEMLRSVKVLIVLDLADEASVILERSISAALGIAEFSVNSFCKVGLITIGKFIDYLPPISSRKELQLFSRHLTNVEASKINNRSLFTSRLNSVIDKLPINHEILLFTSLSDEKLARLLLSKLTVIGNLTLFTPDYYSLMKSNTYAQTSETKKFSQEIINNLFFLDRYIEHDKLMSKGVNVRNWDPNRGFSKNLRR